MCSIYRCVDATGSEYLHSNTRTLNRTIPLDLFLRRISLSHILYIVYTKTCTWQTTQRWSTPPYTTPTTTNQVPDQPTNQHQPTQRFPNKPQMRICIVIFPFLYYYMFTLVLLYRFKDLLYVRYLQAISFVLLYTTHFLLCIAFHFRNNPHRFKVQ